MGRKKSKKKKEKGIKGFPGYDLHITIAILSAVGAIWIIKGCD